MVAGGFLVAAMLVAIVIPFVFPVDYRTLFSKPKRPADLVPLLVSARPIKRYADVVREDLYDPQSKDLSYMWLPKQAIPPTAIRDISMVLGRVMKLDKPAGYAFTEDDFYPRGTRSGAVAGIPVGKRSLRLSADYIYGLHGLMPGDRFDIVATKQIDVNSVSNWQAMSGPAASQLTLQAQLQNLLKQASNFGMGGWWLGGTHMKPNPQFLAEVQAQVPKDAQLVVACQKGAQVPGGLRAAEPRRLCAAGLGQRRL